MDVGYGQAEITPEAGLTLCGFAARQNRPSTGVADSLYVHAMACDAGGQTVLLLVFDLLGLGREVTESIHGALDAGLGADAVPRGNRVLCCTHTHSAPAAIELHGCGVRDAGYERQVVEGALAAAVAAVRSIRPAVMRYVVKRVPSVSYNRRHVLADGRVVMSRDADGEVVKVGPTDDRMLLLRFEDRERRGICGIASWPGHPVTMCTPRVSADFPGELRRRLTEKYGMPFMYLQGACGDLNVPFGDMVQSDMLATADQLMAGLGDPEWRLPTPVVAVGFAGATVPLSYAKSPGREELAAVRAGMGAIAETGTGPVAMTERLANILNVAPGEKADEGMLRHIAGALADWADGLLAADSSAGWGACDLSIQVWRLGRLVFCFVAAEAFVETALALQAAFPELMVTVAAYASPLVGYLPTDEALRDGGYEVENAYRFYGHPAVFRAGSEPAAVQRCKELIAGLLG